MANRFAFGKGNLQRIVETSLARPTGRQSVDHDQQRLAGRRMRDGGKCGHGGVIGQIDRPAGDEQTNEALLLERLGQ